jgi:hypothetical protein
MDNRFEEVPTDPPRCCGASAAVAAREDLRIPREEAGGEARRRELAALARAGWLAAGSVRGRYVHDLQRQGSTAR